MSHERPLIRQQYLQHLSCQCSHFKDLNSLPVELKFGIDTTTTEDLLSNNAKWHQSCYLKFSPSKLKKAQKRKKTTSDDGDGLSKSSKRRKVTGSDEKCVFCDEKMVCVIDSQQLRRTGILVEL